MADSFFQRIELAASESNRLNRAQLDMLGDISNTFTVMMGEVDTIRRGQAAGLELQRAIFARDVFQDSMEDFVYKFGKILKEFRREDTPYSPAVQFVMLRGVIDRIDEGGISTACIRGIDNKERFDSCVTEAREVYRELAKLPEVRRALAEEVDELRRQAALEDKTRREKAAAKEEARREKAAAAAEQATLQREGECRALRVKLKELRSQQTKPLAFDEWYKQSRIYAQPLLVQFVVWLFYGFVWIPALYALVSLFGSAKSMVIDTEVKGLESKLAALESER